MIGNLLIQREKDALSALSFGVEVKRRRTRLDDAGLRHRQE